MFEKDVGPQNTVRLQSARGTLAALSNHNRYLQVSTLPNKWRLIVGLLCSLDDGGMLHRAFPVAYSSLIMYRSTGSRLVNGCFTVLHYTSKFYHDLLLDENSCAGVSSKLMQVEFIRYRTVVIY